MSGCAPGFRRACWSGWQMLMPSARSVSPAVKRYGRPSHSDASATAMMICRCLQLAAPHRRALSHREPDVRLPPMPVGEEVINDYRFLHLSLRAHPSQFLRADLDARGIKQNETLRRTASGMRTRISGLVTCRQRPGSANGVVFMTIEDESAVANVIVWPKVFERLRPIVLGARYVAVIGRAQEESGVIHVVAEQLEDLTYLLAQLAEHGAEINGLARCDEVRRPIEEQREARRTGSRRNRLVSLMREMPELAGDLGVSARGSAHAPTRRAIAAPPRRARH
jgi:error-prone DNA polymerase